MIKYLQLSTVLKICYSSLLALGANKNSYKN